MLKTKIDKTLKNVAQDTKREEAARKDRENIWIRGIKVF